MRLSSWLPVAVVALLMPSATIAALGPIYTYKPPGFSAPTPADFKPLLTWHYSGKPATFHYNVTAASDKNWVGIFYPFGGEPVNGSKVMDPVTWEYVKEQNGEVSLDLKKLGKASYVAYLMANDSYEALAPPVSFHTVDKTVVRYYAHKIRVRAAREGEPWSFDTGRLVTIAGDVQNKHHLVACTGDDWVHSTSAGILYGTPTAHSSRLTTCGIKVFSRNHLSWYMHIQVPVRGRKEPLVPRLRVMSMNLWRGGTRVHDHHAKQVSLIGNLDVDIVSLQETEGIHALRLAHALGWYAYESRDASIISRYPIVEALDSTNKTAAVRIALDGDRQQVVVWAAHLSHEQYGPYGLCFDGRDSTTVLRQEDSSGRAAEAKQLAGALRPYINSSDTVPVLLAGDFNSPSHLDYTAATRELHCGAGEVRWPASWYPIAAGMRDSFREAHPDPVADPGHTWSPIVRSNPVHDHSAEPQDRIDFVYYAGAMRVRDSRAYVLDAHKAKAEPYQANNLWTSDHAAVVTTFELFGKALGKSG